MKNLSEIEQILCEIQQSNYDQNMEKALFAFFEIFIDLDHEDVKKNRLISNPKIMASILNKNPVILDNFKKIVFMLKLDLVEHHKRLAHNVKSKFYTVESWLEDEGWTTNYYRKSAHESTKYFSLNHKPRHSYVSEQKKKELALKQKNKKNMMR